MKYLIGIDIGTSATKTLLMNTDGSILASASYTYGMKQPENGWAEQDPRDWRAAVFTTIKKVVTDSGVAAEDVAGIGLSGQMHGLVMLDENYELICDCIIWCDQRATEQVAEMERILPVEKWIEITANPPIAGWTAAKILWTKENKPEMFAKCRHILLPKDYIRFELTSILATDVSDASGMQLLDVKNRTWSYEVMDKLGFPRDLFAELHESVDIIGCLTEAAAAECGLLPTTVVVAGGSDNACAAIGTGVVRQGEAMISLGTSAVVYSHLDQFAQIPGGGLHTCCCAVPGCWHTMGGPQSAGLSTEWFKNNFCVDVAEKAEADGKNFFSIMAEEMEKIPIGSDRLIYLPFLMGERTPHMTPYYRGAFLGLNVVHTQWHMLKAIMEGISYCLADCNNMLREQGVEIASVRACGGGSKNQQWRKILADLFRCTIYTLVQEEGPAYGAAILAGTGTGLFGSVQEACSAFVKEKDMTQFSETEAEQYAQFLAVYDEMYQALLVPFKKLAEFNKQQI